MLRLFTILLIACAPALWATPSAEQLEFFEQKIRPVLADQCYKCHGPEKQKGELRVDSLAALLKGSDSGVVLVPGEPEKGSLIKSIRHETDNHMPAKAAKMPDEQISAFTEWVKMGAPWPENDKPAANNIADAAKRHWAFQPIANPAIPQPADPGQWASSDLDRFVLAKLEAKHLAPSPIAARYILIRRATFTLTGLPPTAQDVEDFEKDTAPTLAAFSKVVDRLLASPRYGERWGRHWLDVARYADHRGYLAGNDSREYPFAYTYRDWVIRAMNDDLPYDQFLIRQLAADLSGAGPDDLAALGFLTLGRRFLNDQNLIIDDRIDVTIRGTMALTITCARCHDHKFDPVSAKDYYALYGVFASCDEQSDPAKLPLLPGGKASAAYEKARAVREAELRVFDEKTARDLTREIQFATGLPVVLPVESIEALQKARFFTKLLRDDRRKIETKIADSELADGAPPRAHVLTDKPQPVTPHVFIRGNPGRQGDEVPRRFISFLGGDAQPFTKTGSGRLDLAHAIVAKENPLTARVLVNRVWMHQFGTGLVRTPGDFGAKSDPPSEPELLDFLATKFVADGWSLKKLHRTLMLSSTWMQTSDTRADGIAADPDNRLLWHQNRQRLTWEALHDSLLAASGDLDETMFGRPIQMFAQPAAKRRAIYGYIDRQNLPATLRTFDFASPDLMNPQRATTNVPQQALYMLNSPFILARAAALVAAPEYASSGIEPPQVQSLYARVLARPATPEETTIGIKYVTSEQGTLSKEKAASPLWQYGSGIYDPATQRATFTPLPHWTGSAWQGGPKLPDAKLGYVTINAEGGHPAHDLAAIRRFTAPADCTLAISGRVHRPAEAGNGVVARIISSRTGQLTEWIIEPKAALPPPLTSVELKQGDTLDFLLESRGDENSDSFQWNAVLHTATGPEYSSKAQFAGPAPARRSLTSWEKYAQILLETNEFAFVD